jgi:hypothetical protein
MLVRHGVGVIVLTNFGNGDTDAIANRVIRELRGSGALAKPYIPHPSLAPDFDAAMKRFLIAYNAPTEAALRDMLARKPGPGELDELLTYQKLHGACSGFAVAKAKSATSATFALTCERGRFEVETDLVHGKLGGFNGISHGVEIPPVVKTLATDSLSLMDKWNEAVFARTFADPKVSELIKTTNERMHGTLGNCHVSELVHQAQGWGFEATCDRGTAHFYLEEKKGKLTTILITGVDGGSPCSAQ